VLWMDSLKGVAEFLVMRERARALAIVDFIVACYCQKKEAGSRLYLNVRRSDQLVSHAMCGETGPVNW
jgi:hypothetical protein